MRNLHKKKYKINKKKNIKPHDTKLQGYVLNPIAQGNQHHLTIRNNNLELFQKVVRKRLCEDSYCFGSLRDHFLQTLYMSLPCGD